MRELPHLEEELEDVKNVLHKVILKIKVEHLEYYNLANKIEWHISGLIYHYENMLQKYYEVSEQIIERRMVDSNISVIIFHSKEMQSLLYEFYSIVTLSRITLDHISQHTLAPLFNTNQPGSMNAFLKGKTNYRLHKILNAEPELKYLFDTRDCLVHNRTYATSDNTVALSDNINLDDISKEIQNYLEYPITRTYFRVINENTISINLLVPDSIFKYTSNNERDGLVKNFIYTERKNILRTCMDFLMICTASTQIALESISEGEIKKYSWTKNKP